MKPHLLEVNSHPSIYTEPLNMAVIDKDNDKDKDKDNYKDNDKDKYKVHRTPNICYIFEKQRVQGYQI